MSKTNMLHIAPNGSLSISKDGQKIATGGTLDGKKIDIAGKSLKVLNDEILEQIEDGLKQAQAKRVIEKTAREINNDPNENLENWEYVTVDQKQDDGIFRKVIQEPQAGPDIKIGPNDVKQ